ncbi:hypothetical protein CDAR_404681 [Caerostris darwini]|uniref:Secreted protein n=1 Tax=Caerostris darwini TaxID=1538125 RepID=A0AAV4U4W2_9ARAC|nr:hypothetical protein CDAR_404681 [Caerostris darwini]
MSKYFIALARLYILIFCLTSSNQFIRDREYSRRALIRQQQYQLRKQLGRADCNCLTLQDMARHWGLISTWVACGDHPHFLPA